jgi:hypothetical protein
MRVIAFGGRDYADETRVSRALGSVLAKHSGMILIVGYNPDEEKFQGADQLAYEWAKRAGVPVATHPAAWDRHGRAAGPKRNQRMLSDMQPEAGVQFPGGRGTADMRGRLDGAGVPVWEII